MFHPTIEPKTPLLNSAEARLARGEDPNIWTSGKMLGHLEPTKAGTLITWRDLTFLGYPQSSVFNRFTRKYLGTFNSAQMRRNGQLVGGLSGIYSSDNYGWCREGMLVDDYMYMFGYSSVFCGGRVGGYRVHLPSGWQENFSSAMYGMDESKSGIDTLGALLTKKRVRMLANTDKWVLVLYKFDELWQILAISKKDPNFTVWAHNLPEFAWLTTPLTKFSYQFGSDDTSDTLEVFRNRNFGGNTSYAYAAVQLAPTANTFGRAANTAFFIDFLKREAYAVAVPSLIGQESCVVDTDGRMYCATSWVYSVVDPFLRTLRVYPFTSQFMKFATTNRNIIKATGNSLVVPLSPWQVGFVAAKNGEANVTSYTTYFFVIDVFRDRVDLCHQMRADSSPVDKQYPIGHNWLQLDNEGNVFNSNSSYVSTYGGTLDSVAISWLASFNSNGVFSADVPGSKTLGNPGNRWKTLRANNIEPGTSTYRAISLHDVIPIIRTKSLLTLDDPEAINPLQLDYDNDEGKTLRVIGNRLRKTAQIDMTAISTPGEELGVFGVKDQQYKTLAEPSPLPDWFNGCMPVVEGGKWRAGDALVYLPRVCSEASHNNIIFCSEGKRWINKMLPFSCIFTTLPLAFTNLTTDVPIWYPVASADYSNQCVDNIQWADGYSSGAVRPLPNPLLYTRGIDPAELGVSGHLSNRYWLGDPMLSNRPLTNFTQVINGGTGRWRVGDILETIRTNVGDVSQSWHQVANLTTVNRIEDYEPSTLWGEDHKELFDALGRYMNRMFMRGALTQGIPVEVQVQLSEDPSFMVGVTEVTTATAQTGWWFEHTDGGQSPFLVTGPTATTVIGVVFDPNLAGLDFVLNNHNARWRISKGGIWGSWQAVKFVDIEDRWYSILQIEDQKSVNHFVLSNLVDKGWMFTRNPVRPIGGASIFIRRSVSVDDVINVEIQIGDGVVWADAEARDTVHDKTGWSLMIGESVVPYPSDSVFGSDKAGDIHIVFDPERAAVSSVTGTRYCRYRLEVNGVKRPWKVIATATTESNQTRLDMLTVLASDSLRFSDAVVPLVKDCSARTLVSDDCVLDVSDCQYEESGYGITLPEPVEGAVTVVGEGVSRVNDNIQQDWRHPHAIMLETRRFGDYPAMYEYDIWTFGKSAITHAAQIAENQLMCQPAAYCWLFTSGYYAANYPTHYMHLPGTSRVHVARRSMDVSLSNYDLISRHGKETRQVHEPTGRFLLLQSNFGGYLGSIVLFDTVLGSFNVLKAQTPNNYNGVDCRAPIALSDGLILLPSTVGECDHFVCEPYSGLTASVGLRRMYQGWLNNRYTATGSWDYRYSAFNHTYHRPPIMGYRGIHACFYGAGADNERILRLTDNGELTVDAPMLMRGRQFFERSGNDWASAFGTGLLLAQYMYAHAGYTSALFGAQVPMRGGIFFKGSVSGRATNSIYTHVWSPGGGVIYPGNDTGHTIVTGDSSGLHWKSGSIYQCSVQCWCPGGAIATFPVNVLGQSILDTTWYDCFSGLARSHNIDRLGKLLNYNNVAGIGDFNRCLYPTTTPNGLHSTAIGRCFEVGDVFPGIGLVRGEHYARLAIGSKVGRRV